MSISARSVYVVDAVRTPIGRYGGGLATVRPDDLAAHVLAGLVARQPAFADRIDQVVFGATNQAGEDNRNVARMAALIAGLAYEVPAVTVNRLCGSGLEAVADAARMIALGEADCVIAGGVESMTRAPFSMPKATDRFDRTPPPVYDTTLGWRYPNPKLAARFELLGMGETAENVAKKHGISRDDQDAFALASQQKTEAAQKAGKFKDEILPLEIAQKKGAALVFDADEYPKHGSTLEALAGLRAAFDKNGTVTAGNASGITDGAAAVIMMSAKKAQELGLKPLATIRAYASAGVDPKIMGMGPVAASRLCLAQAGWSVDDLDLMEINEAFDAQAIAVNREMKWDTNKVNVNGGAIAIGHPIGASGCRILVTLLHEMIRRDAKKGFASLCIGGGMGVALAVER